jgi:two-component system, response regulator PdtaR
MHPTVLIVEDEQIVAADLEKRLEKLGYRVVGTAATGEEAVALADLVRPDVVLMDIELQGAMSGTEAAKRIQLSTGAPIIFVTAYAGVFVKNPGDMQAPGICISKPFGTLQLKAALDSVAPVGKTM